MPNVDIDLVDIEDALDLLQDCCTRCFNTISAEDRVNVVGVDGRFVDKTVHVATSELPQARNVGPVGGQLSRR